MKLALDIGHGMGNATPGKFDPGTVHAGVREADLALAYGLELQALLHARDIATFMTRVDNNSPTPVSMRAVRAARMGCSHLVSLHFNSAEDKLAHGTEVLYRRPEDKGLAEKLSQEIAYALGLFNRGAKVRNNLAVLKFSLGPAVLIEFGFLSHEGDRAAVLNERNRKAACEAIVGELSTSTTRQ